MKSLLLPIALLALSVVQIEAQCGGFVNLPYKYSWTHEWLTGENFFQEPCSCQLLCTYQDIGLATRSCNETRDQCDECEVCVQPACSEWQPPTLDGRTVEICEPLNVGICTCCVREPAVWLESCAFAPVYNSTCGDICELCTTVCGYSYCEWLDNTVPKEGYSQDQINAIQDFIAITLSGKYAHACVPADVKQIIIIIGSSIVLDECMNIDLTSNQLAILNNYLSGSEQAPQCDTCPTCTPPEPAEPRIIVAHH